MALSGVERLFQYARDLEVEPARSPRRAERPAAAQPGTASSSDGIKLSLSSAATEATPPDAVGENARAPAAYGPRESSTVAATNAPRAGSAVSAYQRQGAAELGQRIAVRA